MTTLFAGRRLLALIPHPDDEAYSMAGLLAHASQQGADVWVVSATRGEAGYDHHHPAATPAEVGETRSAELAASCRLLGAQLPRFLDWPDGGIAECVRSHAIADLVALIRDIQPSVLVSLGPDGAYGHADHVALWELTRLALVSIATSEPTGGFDIRWLVAAFPSALFDAQWRQMTQGRDAERVTDTPPTLGVGPDEVSLRLSLADLRDIKRRSIGAHHSQLVGADPTSLFPPGIVQALLDQERFQVALGLPLPPGSTDPFADLPD